MTKVADGRRVRGGDGPGALAVVRLMATAMSGGLRLLLLFLPLFPRIGAYRRRAKRGFRRALDEAGLPRHVVNELAAHYTIDWRDLLRNLNLPGVPFVGRGRERGPQPG